MPFQRRFHECPACGKTGKIYFRRNSYAAFVCFCGVLITAFDLGALKQQLKEMRRENSRRR